MRKLEFAKRILRRWFISLPFFVALGLILGAVIAILLIPKPVIATISIAGVISDQSQVDDVLDALERARFDNSIRAVILRIDSPGGGVSAVEQIYLDVLRLRQQKPVVVSVGTIAASGGYYVAVAANFIYAEPTSQVGSIGAWVSLPEPEKLDENVATTGPFKATGYSKRKAMGVLDMVRQEFVEAVVRQRGARLKLSEEEVSQAQIYVGVEALRCGLIDAIGTRTAAVEKAASLAGIRNYEVGELSITSLPPLWFFGPSDLQGLKAQTGLIPKYYYLYFESE